MSSSRGRLLHVISSNSDYHTNFYLEPIDLDIGNEYNLNVIKEITATSSFLSMDRNVKICQVNETFDECVTRKYIEGFIKKCKCLPLDLRLTEKVFLFDNLKTFSSVL